MKRRSRFSPVLTKELVQIAASRQSAILRVVYLCLLASLSYLAISQTDLYRVDIGKNLFVYLVTFQTVAAFVLTPIVTAGVVAGERQANTLGLLLITQMTHRNVIQDKSLSRIAYMLKFGLMTMPFMFLSVMLGGVDWAQIVLVELVVTGTVCAVGSFATYQSVIRKSYVMSLTSCYTYLFIYFIISAAVVGLMVSAGNGDAGFAFIFNPAFLMAWLLDEYGGASTHGWAIVVYFLLTMGIFYFLFLYVARTRLAALIAADKLGPAGEVEDDDKAGEPLSWQKMKNRQVKLPAVRLVPHTATDFSMRRSLRKLARFFVDHPVITFFCGLAAAALIRHLGLETFRSYGFYSILFGPVGFLLFFMTIVRSTTAFSTERQFGRLELILSTPMSGKKIVLQTTHSVLKPLWPFWVGLMAVTYVGSLVSRHDPYWHGQTMAVPSGALYWATYLLFMVAVCLFISLKCRNNARALGLVMAIVALHWIGPLVLKNLLDMEVLCLFSPLNWFLYVLNGSGIQDDRELAWDLYPVFVIGHTIALVGLYAYLATGFDRIVHRQPS